MITEILRAATLQGHSIQQRCSEILPSARSCLRKVDISQPQSFKSADGAKNTLHCSPVILAESRFSAFRRASSAPWSSSTRLPPPYWLRIFFLELAGNLSHSVWFLLLVQVIRQKRSAFGRVEVQSPTSSVQSEEPQTRGSSEGPGAWPRWRLQAPSLQTDTAAVVRALTECSSMADTLALTRQTEWSQEHFIPWTKHGSNSTTLTAYGIHRLSLSLAPCHTGVWAPCCLKHPLFERERTPQERVEPRVRRCDASRSFGA